MPYVFYEELPDGMDEVDVVPRADYDALVEERDSTIQQRDDALTQIEEARKEVRDVKAKYADTILTANRKSKTEPKPEPKRSKPSLAMSTSELFVD